MGVIDAVNPTSGETFETITTVSPEAVTDMMKNGRQAFVAWQDLSVSDRLAYMGELRRVIVNDLAHCVDTIAQDTGKPSEEAISSEVLPVLDAIRHMEKQAEDILQTRKVGTTLILIGKKSYVSYQPRGVVSVISPWNYPFFLSMSPVISALVAGNSVILKPSEITPAVGELIQSLFVKAGFPQDVLQVAQGEGDVGAALTQANPDYIFFTGSVPTGRKIQQAAAEKLIPTTLELGGNDPMIIFADAHLDRAVQGALWGSFTNCGQMCIGTERIYVEESIYEEFLEKLQAEVQALSRPNQQNPDLGSMTFEKQVAIVRDHVNDALNQGAHMISGFHPEDWPAGMNLEPMILTSVSDEMKVNREETFGPVVTVVPFTDEKEAVRQANSSDYGLGASVWSQDIQKARHTAEDIAAGSVAVNDVVTFVANPHLPFGGIKQSGIGRDHGAAGLRSFCNEQSMIIDPGRKQTEVNWFPYRDKLPSFQALIRARFRDRTHWPQFLKAFLDLLRKSKK